MSVPSVVSSITFLMRSSVRHSTSFPSNALEPSLTRLKSHLIATLNASKPTEFGAERYVSLTTALLVAHRKFGSSVIKLVSMNGTGSRISRKNQRRNQPASWMMSSLVDQSSHFPQREVASDSDMADHATLASQPSVSIQPLCL